MPSHAKSHWSEMVTPGLESPHEKLRGMHCAIAPSSAPAERPCTAEYTTRHAQTIAEEAAAPNPREETHLIITRHRLALCTFPRQALVHTGNYPTWHGIRRILVACKAQSGTHTPVRLLIMPSTRRIPRPPHSECSNEALECLLWDLTNPGTISPLEGENLLLQRAPRSSK